jgi:hypothetical protein
MTNLVFAGISPTTVVGANSTPKADVAFIQKETYERKGGDTVTTFKVLIATAWRGTIDLFKGATPGCIVPSLEIKCSSRILKGKKYNDINVESVDNKFFTKELSPETKKALDDLIADFKTTFDGSAPTYTAPTNTAKKDPAPTVDDGLPF